MTKRQRRVLRQAIFVQVVACVTIGVVWSWWAALGCLVASNFTWGCAREFQSVSAKGVDS